MQDLMMLLVLLLLMLSVLFLSSWMFSLLVSSMVKES
jgi:hypothetical protein